MSDLEKIRKPDFGPDQPDPAIGEWYWVKYEDGDRVFMCVTHIGSNYAGFTGPIFGHGRHTTRVHFDQLADTCEHVPSADAEALIKGKVQSYRETVRELLGEIKQVTAKLSITPRGEIAEAPGDETRALSVSMGDQHYKKYEKQLVKAKEKTLPDLFKRMKNANEMMAGWMTAMVVPLEAQADKMGTLVRAIDDRIFNVKLYAGLVEQITKIKDGAPAPNDTKVHLMQRRCYMDEECLAQYQTGGMEYADIRDFDRWLAKPENHDRIFPQPRCVVAFRVRRNGKQRTFENADAFIRFLFSGEAEWDKTTFLYVRNGDQLYRVDTEIDFGHHLFPDVERRDLGKIAWAKLFADDVRELITEEEHRAFVAEQEEIRIKRESVAENERWRYSGSDRDDYVPFKKSNVYYDDISEKIGRQIKDHNRIVLVLQGLLDRSQVFHPHPPWQLWTEAGFLAAFELVYDSTRALSDGDKPDFEAYRARLNASLKQGSWTVGQQKAWERVMAERENEKNKHKERYYEKTFYTPYGNPGPGKIARVAEYHPRSKKCAYEWQRERTTYTRSHWWNHKEGSIAVNFATESSNLLNIDAYEPGDFKQFFDDPRTREEYLQWAPLLLEAEEFHAGNREKYKRPTDEEESK